MIYFLFFILSISLLFFYFVNDRKVFSCTIVGLSSYILSSLVLIISYSSLHYDITWLTIFIIEGSMIFFGIGEIIGIKMIPGKICYPNLNHTPYLYIANKYFRLCLVIILINCVYVFYRFNYIGSQLGGSSFILKYILLRQYLTSEEGVRGVNEIVVPYENYLSYLSFLSSAIVFTLIFVYSYNLCYHGIVEKKLLLPFILYFPSLVFSTTRSIFISTITIILVIVSLVYIQSHKGWNNQKIRIKIINGCIYAMLAFGLIFSIVGSFKEQDVFSNFTGTMTGYIGAPIIGLDQYLCGNIHAKSDYPGQVTLEGLIAFLNHFGFNHNLATYHQEDFTFGPYVSNIFSAPYYMLRDYHPIIVMFIFMFWGIVIGRMIGKIQKCDTPYFLPMRYIVLGYLFYPTVMLPITDAFRHIVSIPFGYTLICLYLVQRLLIKKSITFKYENTLDN